MLPNNTQMKSSLYGQSPFKKLESFSNCAPKVNYMNNINNRPNIGFNNNNFMKNKNSNTQTDFYNDRQFNNNMINYTPLIKDRSMGDNQLNINNSSSNKNKNMFQQENQGQNYNPVRGFNNGRPMSGVNNFNNNIRNQNKKAIEEETVEIKKEGRKQCNDILKRRK